MKLLVKTNYTGPFDDPCNVTHALVDIDPRNRLDMRAKLADVLALPNIYSVTFFDDTPQPVVCEFEDEAPAWFDVDVEVLAIPEDVSPQPANLRTAAPTVRYMPEGVMWHFYDKHGSESYETATIPWQLMQAAVKERGGNRAQIPR
jgi:hypothetical protein